MTLRFIVGRILRELRAGRTRRGRGAGRRRWQSPGSGALAACKICDTAGCRPASVSSGRERVVMSNENKPKRPPAAEMEMVQRLCATRRYLVLVLGR